MKSLMINANLEKYDLNKDLNKYIHSRVSVTLSARKLQTSKHSLWAYIPSKDFLKVYQ